MTFLEYDFAGDHYDNPSDSYDGGSPVPNYAQPVLQVAMTDPLSPVPEWTAITQWCLSADTAYGRQHELQQIEAQTLQAVMDDRTGLFSGWNFLSPWTNLLQYSDSVIPSTGGTNNWTAGTDTTLLPLGGGVYCPDPTLPVLALSRNTSTGSAIASIASAGYVPVTAGTTYTGFAAFSAFSTPRSCTVGIAWYNSSHSLISTSTGSAITDSTTSYTKATVTHVAPSGAVWATLVLTVASAANGETHLTCRFGITQQFVDSLGIGSVTINNTAFGPGGYGLTIGKPLQLLASTTDNATVYPCAYAYLETIVPTITDEMNRTIALNASDMFKYFTNDVINYSLYPGLVILDGASLYWRLGDPIGTSLVSDFSQSGNMGQILTPFGPLQLGQPSLIDQDVNGSVLLRTETIYLFGDQYSNPPVTEVSLDLWVQVGGASSGLFAFATYGEMTINLDTNGNAQWGANGVYYYTSGTPTQLPIADGQNHHLALTYSNVTGAFIGYQDGVEQFSVTVGTGLINSVTDITLQNTGAVPSITLDEFAIYPSVLTAEQIADHFDIGLVTADESAQPNGYTIPGGSTTSDILILLFLLGAGFPLWMLAFDVGVSEVFCPTITVGSTTLISTINQIVASEQGLLYQDRSGYLVYLNRHYAIQAAAATQLQGTFNNSASSQLFYLPANFQPTIDDEDLWNDVPTQTQTITESASGGNTSPLYDATNITSVAHFGLRSLQGYTSMLYADQLEAQALGQYLLLLYSVPFTRVRQAQISSAANLGAALPQMLERDLIDLLGFIYNPQDAGDNFDEAAQVEKIQHRVRPGALWLTTYQLNPYFYNGGPYFTLNDTVKGVLAGTGSTAANELGF